MTDDRLAAALAMLPTEALSDEFSSRVLAVARTELALPPEERPSVRFDAALRGALVPALLTVAAVGRTTLTVEAAATIYQDVAASDTSKP